VSSIRHELNLLGRGQDIASVESVPGGVVSDVWLVTYHDGSRIVAKTSFDVPKDFFAVEAEGLKALSSTGLVRTVEVLAVTEHMLVMEALGHRDDSPAAWVGFAHDLAALHLGTVHDRFGWGHDTYLGWLPQENTWSHDGHRFFVEHRPSGSGEEFLQPLPGTEPVAHRVGRTYADTSPTRGPRHHRPPRHSEKPCCQLPEASPGAVLYKLTISSNGGAPRQVPSPPVALGELAGGTKPRGQGHAG
jgi:hypothetical protein